jgi:CIC family chloride channel protein
MSAAPHRRLRTRRRDRAVEHSFVVLVAIACGLAGAAGAIGLRALVQGFAALAFGGEADSLAALFAIAGTGEPELMGVQAPGWRRLIAPALGGAVVGPLLYWLARESRGHGVPAVMEAVARRGGVIRPRVVAVTTLASALTIGTGGSAGREGPIVQIGAAIGSVIGQLLRLPPRQMRTLVGCGAAAGIAATFNAPIAGALFAAEVILLDFATARLTPIVISSVVATVVSRAVLGDHPSFQAPSWELVSPWELVAYGVLGIGAGFLGVGFGSSLHASERFFERLRLPDPVKPALGGLLVGAIGISLPYVFGSGYGTVNAALEGRLGLGLLALLVLAKIAATSLTLGSGATGGVFAPALFLGAVAGGAFGGVAHLLFPTLTASSGAYALVGMGAVLSSTSHAPITAIIMIFELTRSISIIPPLMISCVIATLVASTLRSESIYTRKLVERGVDLLAEKDPNVLRALRVRDLVNPDVERVPANASFQEVLDLVVRSPRSEFFVVDSKGALLGAFSGAQLRRLLFEEESLRGLIVAADLVDTDRPTLRASDDLDSALQLLSASGVSELAVVAEDDPTRLVGTLHVRDVLEAYHREMLERDLAGGLSARVGLAERAGALDLGSGFVLAELEVPRAFAGRTLREIDLRARHGVQVLLLRATGEDEMRVPTPEDRLQLGDVLVVAGPAEAVKRLEGAEWGHG